MSRGGFLYGVHPYFFMLGDYMYASKKYVENFSGQIASYESMPRTVMHKNPKKNKTELRPAGEEQDVQSEDKSKSKDQPQSGETAYSNRHDNSQVKSYALGKPNDQTQMP